MGRRCIGGGSVERTAFCADDGLGVACAARLSVCVSVWCVRASERQSDAGTCEEGREGGTKGE